MIDFVSDFADGKISGYVIEHFPLMDRENARLARKFANTVEYAQTNNISDDDYRVALNNALCDLLGIDEPDLI